MQKFEVRLKEWREGTATIEVQDDWTDDDIQTAIKDLKSREVAWDDMPKRGMLGVKNVS